MLGTTAIAVLAWQRGEAVNALWMVVAAACVFAVAYRFHSAWLMANVLTLDELRATPAVVHEDGKDFVQTNRWVVFGHHFAAIAGPGPLVGPVLAAQFNNIFRNYLHLFGCWFSILGIIARGENNNQKQNSIFA